MLSDYFSPAAAARRMLTASGFLSPRAMSASSSNLDPVGVAKRSFQARSPLSPFKLDLDATHKSSAVTLAGGFLDTRFFGKVFPISCLGRRTMKLSSAGVLSATANLRAVDL